MRKSVLAGLLFFCCLVAHSQSDSISFSRTGNNLHASADEHAVSVYPVPVRDNTINIRSSAGISSVRITSIIGMEIFRADYRNNQTLIKIILDNPERGIYLVSIRFTDNSRIVRKIMIESTF